MINHIISNESIESAIVSAALALDLWCPSPSDASHSKGPTAGAGSRIGEGALANGEEIGEFVVILSIPKWIDGSKPCTPAKPQNSW